MIDVLISPFAATLAVAPGVGLGAGHVRQPRRVTTVC